MLGDADRRRRRHGVSEPMSADDMGESIEPSKAESIEPVRTLSREKVIVRSNGVVTYVGKDIANQFWKFGLLGRDFLYRRFATQADDRVAVVDHVRERRAFGTAFREGRTHLQRDRFTADVSAGAPEPGAPRARARPRGRELDSFFLRDGGALARHGARARLRDRTRERGGKEAVRRSLRPEGARRENRRSARPADEQGVGRGGQAQSRFQCRPNASASRCRSRSGRSGTSC